MKGSKRWITFIAGMVTMALICALSGTVLAAGTITDLKDVLVGGIRIVIDGQELHPTDAQGNPVAPMIYNGTTYLPVRAVASAIGKAVYWDGPNYTVYLGNMEGALEYPTVMIKDMVSVGDKVTTTNKLKDNYGNTYASAIQNFCAHDRNYEYLLDMKYSRFKGTLYVPEGNVTDHIMTVTINADGHQIYSSPQMSITSHPEQIDVDVTGYNDVKIEFHGSGRTSGGFYLCLADAGFYQ